MKQFDEDEDFWDTLVDDTDITAFLDIDYDLNRIQEAMKQLDPLSKDIVYFKFIEEKSYEEIVALVEISPDALRQRLSRAIKQLKELLADIG